MKSTTYTVREVAAIISGSNAPKVIDRVVRQLRYWTNEGLINPEGGRHTGSGRHREYCANEIRKAAITAELARHGMSISVLCSVDGYYDDMEDDSRWDRAVKGDEDVFFVYAKEFGEDGGSFSNLFSSDRERDPLFILKSKDIDEVNMDGKSMPIMDYKNFPSCLIINLTKLFARLSMK